MNRNKIDEKRDQLKFNDYQELENYFNNKEDNQELYCLLNENFILYIYKVENNFIHGYYPGTSIESSKTINFEMFEKSIIIWEYNK